ncbi:hypothetical protein GCM10029992_66880 [Glycomyces albus]
MQALYTAHATSSGAGRDGHVATDDGRIDLDLAIQKELGGPGGKSNPEQLFAAGYAACFHSALQAVARAEKVDLGASTVEATVGIGKEGEGFGLNAVLEVSTPAPSARSPRAWWPRPTWCARTRTPPAATSRSTSTWSRPPTTDTASRARRPQAMILKSARPSTGSSVASTRSTRAPLGPCPTHATIASTAASRPSNTASTVPSCRLRTQPTTPLASAWREHS